MFYQPYVDAEEVAQAAADALFTGICNCLANNRLCHVALPGGTTPACCLLLLSQKDLPWSRIHWYLSDERCLPVGHEQRNDLMLERNLWSRASIPAENRHPILAELGAASAADEYAELIRDIGRLDVVVLGMGEDGHTASLFPQNKALDDKGLVVSVKGAPKPPAERVSLGLAAIQQARLRLVLVTGAGKREAMCQLQQGFDLPVSHIGEAHWYVDAAASCL